MHTETVFRILTATLLSVAFSISGYYRRKADRRGGELDKSGNGVLVVMRLVGLAVFLPLFLYLINPAWVGWAQVVLPEWLRWLGVVGAATAVPFLFWLFHTIGNNISASHTVRKDHQLITHGPYRWIRHPLYTFGSLFFLSLALVAQLWWLAVGGVIAFALLAWRTGKEEANLVAQFGEEYRAYQAQTGRFLPRLR